MFLLDKQFSSYNCVDEDDLLVGNCVAMPNSNCHANSMKNLNCVWGGGVVFELCTASRVKTVDNLSRKKKRRKG